MPPQAQAEHILCILCRAVAALRPSLCLWQPVVLERVPSDEASKPGGGCTWIHTKALYRLTKEAKQIMKGCSDDMCSTSAMLTGVRVSDWIEED